MRSALLVKLQEYCLLLWPGCVVPQAHLASRANSISARSRWRRARNRGDRTVPTGNRNSAAASAVGSDAMNAIETYAANEFHQT